MVTINNQVKEYDFTGNTKVGLFIAAGGFEDRALTFATRLRNSCCSIEDSLLLHYKSQHQENEPNYNCLRTRLKEIVGKNPKTASVHADTPIQSSGEIKRKIEGIASQITDRTALVDISGMTHLWALSSIQACLSCGFRTSVVYTEAKRYFPPEQDRQQVHRWPG